MYKALIIVNNESIPPKMSLHKVSDRHMTYNCPQSLPVNS